MQSLKDLCFEGGLKAGTLVDKAIKTC
jgi:hypothetical protein